MPKKEIIERHITQGPYVVRSGETVKAKIFIQTGAVYGRVIFTEHAPMMLVEGAKDAKGVWILHCEFIGLRASGGSAIEVRNNA